MKQFTFNRKVGVALVAGLALSLGAFAIAQNQTTSTSQSQSGGGSSSASASASSRAQSGGSVMAGQSGTATGSAVGTPVKGAMYVVYWTPNLSARAGGDVISQHQEYLNTYGKQVGVLMEGMVGGENPGRMAIIQGQPQLIREFAMGSPLVQSQVASFTIAPYSVTYSRVGVVADASGVPGADGVNSSSSKNSQSSQSSQSSQTTQSSGSGGG